MGYERPVGAETMTWPLCRLTSCPDFMLLSPEEKGKVVENIRACPKCLAWNQARKHCPRRGYPCKAENDGVKCKGLHDEMLHESGNKYCEATLVMAEVMLGQTADTRVLLPIQMVPVRGQGAQAEASLLWDTGATISLCTHDWARANGLEGDPTSFFLKVVNRDHEEVRSCVYGFHMLPRKGSPVFVRALGVESISSEEAWEPGVDELKDFPEISREQIRRQGGSVDVLLGLDVVQLHPQEI